MIDMLHESYDNRIDINFKRGTWFYKIRTLNFDIKMKSTNLNWNMIEYQCQCQSVVRVYIVHTDIPPCAVDASAHSTVNYHLGSARPVLSK